MAIDDRPTITEHAWRLAVVDRVVGARQLPVESIAQAGEQAPGSPAPHYEIAGRLGKGGMALVLDARQTSLERGVALKIFRPSGEDGADLAEELRQFAHEAVVTARLDHPNIVPVYALAKDHKGRLFFTMKKVDGTPWRFLLHPLELRDPNRETQVRLRAEALDWQEHIRILLKVMDAVAYAHSKGVLHRDLKPSNVMIGDFGEVYVMDWGLAMGFGPDVDLQDEEPTANEIKVAGTPRYMAPEMITGKKSRFSEATDVHLLGGILFEIVTGQPPRAGKNTHEIIAAAVAGKVEDPARVPGARHVTPHIRRIILKAMAADPADRYSNVTVMRADLEAYLIHADAITEAEDAALDLATLSDGLIVAGPDGTERVRALPRDDAVVAYDALAEVISRLRQSLSRYPNNGAARSALLDALLLQIRLAIGQRDLTLAEAQLKALDQVPGPGTDETFTRTVNAHRDALSIGIWRERRRIKSGVRTAAWLKAAVIVLIVLAAGGLGYGYLMAAARSDQAQAEEARMFQTAVRGQAKMIEEFLLDAERLTLQYQDEAIEYLTTPYDQLAPRSLTAAGRRGFYYDEDFYDPATQPPDLRAIEGYDKPVSLTQPTVVRAPWARSGENAERAEADAARLARLGHRFGQVHRTWGTDLKWSLAGTRSGLLIGFPGSGRYKDRADYDPTLRPWFKLAADAQDDAPHWGTPYTDATTGLRLIPCMARVRVGEDTIAAVGVEVTLARVQRMLLDFALDSGDDRRAMLLRTMPGAGDQTMMQVLVDTADEVRGQNWRTRVQMPTLDDIAATEPVVARFVREVLVDRDRSPVVVDDRLFTHAFLDQHDNWILVVTSRHDG